MYVSKCNAVLLVLMWTWCATFTGGVLWNARWLASHGTEAQYIMMVPTMMTALVTVMGSPFIVIALAHSICGRKSGLDIVYP